YTLLVIPYGTQTGSTTVKINDVPPDWTGPIVPGGSAVTATVTAPGQNASMTFSGTANHRVSVQVTAGTWSATDSLHAPTGQQLFSGYWGGGAGGFFDVTTLPSDGTYTLFIDGYAERIGSTTVQLNDVPPDWTGLIVPGGADVTATVTVPGQN